MQRDAGARADFITEHDAREKLGAVAARTAIDDGEQRRQHGHPRVTFRQHVSVVRIERVDRRGPCECRAGDARAATVEEHARPAVDARHLRRGVAVDNRRGRCARAAGCDADQIEQAAPRLRNDIGRDRFELQRANERGDVGCRHTRACGGRHCIGHHFSSPAHVGDRPAVLREQFALQHLAAGIGRQAVEKHDAARPLVRREIGTRAAERVDRGGRETGSRPARRTP